MVIHVYINPMIEYTTNMTVINLLSCRDAADCTHGMIMNQLITMCAIHPTTGMSDTIAIILTNADSKNIPNAALVSPPYVKNPIIENTIHNTIDDPVVLVVLLAIY